MHAPLGSSPHDDYEGGCVWCNTHTSYDDPGWYVDLPGTFTVPATLEQLNRDRIGL
jgi:hypothetical protein